MGTEPAPPTTTAARPADAPPPAAGALPAAGAPLEEDPPPADGIGMVIDGVLDPGVESDPGVVELIAGTGKTNAPPKLAENPPLKSMPNPPFSPEIRPD